MARYRIKRMPLHWARILPSAHCLKYQGRVFHISWNLSDAIKAKRRLIQQDKEKRKC